MIYKIISKILMLFLFVIVTFNMTYFQSLFESSYTEKVFAEDRNSQFVEVSKNPAQKNTDRSNIDPRTLSILREMTQFIGIKNNYTFKAELMYDNILDSGQKLQVTASEKVFLEKSDKVFIDYNGDYSAYKFLYNHDKVILLDTTTNLYTQVQAPETINATFDRLLKVYGFAPPLSDLFYLFPYKSMIENVESSTYVGSSVVFGVRCHHLAFVEKDKDWQIWIEKGNRKIPRKIVINYKNIPGSPQFIAIIRDWILNEPFSDLLFKQNLTKNAAESDQNLLYNKSVNNLGIIRGP